MNLVWKGNQARIVGALCITDVTRMQDQPLPESRSKKLTVDLASVTRIDSAGIALLLHWRRLAHLQGSELQIKGVTDHIRDLIKLCRVHWLLS